MIHDIFDRWCICTPTKTGTTSITALLTKQTRSCALKVLPVHRADADAHFHDRIMTCRHPLDRWVSMYHFLRRDRSWGHGAALEGVGEFARHFFATYDDALARGDMESIVMWGWEQWRIIDRFKPTRLFDVCADSGASLLAYLSSTYGYKFRSDEMPALNVTKGRPHWVDTIMLLREESDELFTRLLVWSERDFDELNVVHRANWVREADNKLGFAYSRSPLADAISETGQETDARFARHVSDGFDTEGLNGAPPEGVSHADLSRE